MRPFKPRSTVANGPEAKLQDAVIIKLRGMQWYCKVIHGNLYMSGLPDLYVAHYQYGPRWIECKIMPYGRLRASQLQTFRELNAVNVPIWVVTHLDEVPNILFKPQNWHLFLGH